MPATPPSSDLLTTWAKSALVLAAPVSLCLGVLYLLGYWTQFGINVLQFASISDVVASALLPLMLSLATIVFGAILGTLSTTGKPTLDSSTMPPTEPQPEVLRWKVLLPLWALLSLCIFLFLNFTKWYFFPFLISVPIVYAAIWHPRIAVYREAIGFIAIYIISIIVPGAFSTGRLHAEQIKEGVDYQSVASVLPHLSIEKSGDTQSLRYIGHAGDYDFLYRPRDKATVVMKMPDDKPLILKHIKTDTPPRFVMPEAITKLLQIKD